LLWAHGRDLPAYRAARVGRVVARLNQWWEGASQLERDQVSQLLEPSEQLPERVIFPVEEGWDRRAELPPEKWIRGFDRRGWKLHAYQARALAFLRDRPRALLAMEMGLGKTLIGVMWLARLFAEKQIRRAVIVAPVSSMSTWAEHIDLTALRARVMNGWSRERRAGAWEDLRTGAADLVVISPQGISRTARRTFDSDQALSAMRAGGGALLIDEAHKIKAAESAMGRTIGTISRAADRCVGMTGTPKPNRIDDFYITLSRIAGPALGSVEDFRARYTYPKEDFFGADEYITGPLRADRLAELWRLCAPVVFARTGSDPDALIPLPPRHDETPEVDLDDVQREIAKRIPEACALALDAPYQIESWARSEDWRERVLAEAASTAPNATGLRLEQLAVCPSIFSDTFRRHFPDYISPKTGLIVERLSAHFEQQAGSAAVIFCEWILGLEAIQRALISRGVVKRDRIAIYCGQVSTRDRAQIIRDLNDGELDVIVAQHRSLETGANLQARCSFVAHASTPWAPDTLVQTTGRVHRQGQRREVFVVRPSGSTVEQAKNRALSLKIRETAQLLGAEMTADRYVLRSSAKEEGRKWARIYAERLRAYTERGEL
jgi:SNF2 family DNA or RNA helicase